MPVADSILSMRVWQNIQKKTIQQTEMVIRDFMVSLVKAFVKKREIIIVRIPKKREMRPNLDPVKHIFIRIKIEKKPVRILYFVSLNQISYFLNNFFILIKN